MWAVVSELGMVSALDLHHIFGVIQFVFHALIERTIDRERLLHRIVTVKIGPQQNQAIHLLGMLAGKLRGHGPAHGMAGQIPMLHIGKLLHRILGGIGIKNGHVEGHIHQNARCV